MVVIYMHPFLAEAARARSTSALPAAVWTLGCQEFRKRGTLSISSLDVGARSGKSSDCADCVMLHGPEDGDSDAPAREVRLVAKRDRAHVTPCHGEARHAVGDLHGGLACACIYREQHRHLT